MRILLSLLTIARVLSSQPDFISDPGFPAQEWYLGASGANVVAAWERGYSGKGITIFFQDDGLDYTHDDFSDKFVGKASWSDPMPGTCKSTSEVNADSHGQTCAGIAAAAANDKCGVGVAYDALVAAANIYRDFNFPNLQMQFGTCNSTGNAHHISSNSWGIDACADMLLDDDGGRRLASGTCPFLPASVNPKTPCTDSWCSEGSWDSPDSDCEDAIYYYCSNSDNHAAVGYMDPACADWQEYWVQCQYNSLSNDDIEALRNAVTYGRNGKGTIFVFAAGNEFATYENMNAEGYINSRYVISVGAIAGDNKHALYSSEGACLLISAPGGDTDQDVNMYETLPKLEGECRVGDKYSVGTSYATPVVSGIVALMLEANGELGWRDVQDILVRSANSAILADVDANENTPVSTNAAGLRHHDTLGFGKVDALAAVIMAEERPKSVCNVQQKQLLLTSTEVMNIGTTTASTITISAEEVPFFSVQHAVVYVTIDVAKRGDVEVALISPSNVKSIISPFSTDQESDYDNWKFMSVKNWGELPSQISGDWVLEITNAEGGTSSGNIREWKLNLFGDDKDGNRVEGWGTGGCQAVDTAMWEEDVTFDGICYQNTMEDLNWEEPNGEELNGGGMSTMGGGNVNGMVGGWIAIVMAAVEVMTEFI